MSIVGYTPLIIVGAFFLFLLIGGIVTRRRVAKLAMNEKILVGYVTTGIDRNGKPTYKYTM